MEVKKKKEKACNHRWVYDAALLFKGFSSDGMNDYYRAVYHCEKCMQQDIQTIYR